MWRWIFGFPSFLVDEVDGWGSALALPPLPAFSALLLLGGGEGLEVFFFLLAGSLRALTVDFNWHRGMSSHWPS